MVRRRLSDMLDELDAGKQKGFWHKKLEEMLVLLKEKKYRALERMIGDLLESDIVTGKKKGPESGAQRQNRAEQG